MKKAMSILMAAALAAGACSGISVTAEESIVTEAGTFPIVTEPVTLKVFLVQPANISSLDDNEVTKYIEEKTGVNLEIISATNDSAKEKMSVLLASGDYPDMFLATGPSHQFTNEELLLYGAEQGIFIPLNDLIEEYGDSIKTVIESDEEYASSIVAPDGNIYGLPSWELAYHCSYPAKAWINQTWLDNLGLETPTTTDEFYEVLKAFKEQDANGNGDPSDEIPLTGTYTPTVFLMNAFIYTSDSNYFYINEDGVLDYAPMQEEWREGLRYMKKLYDEDLLDSGAFTQSREQIKTMGTNPDAALLGTVTCLHPGHFVTISDDDLRHTEYTALEPLIGPEGAQYAMYGVEYTGASCVITDTCEYPEAAFRLADYLASAEGTLLTTTGLEGVGWRKAEEGELNILGEQADYTRIEYTHVSGTANADNWGNENFHFTGSEMTGLRGKWTYSQDVNTLDGYETRLFQETETKYEGKRGEQECINVFISPEEVDEAYQLKVNLEDYVSQSTVRFITGDLDIETDWDAYLSQLETLQVSKYLEIYNTAYQSK
ncbi:MAG: extracellular solute-binding protein [Eubacteriales bacterium]|nr:extracellular solute-binding protein [Eubacteriales bacterium]